VDCGGLLYEVFKTIREIKPFPEAYAADWSLHKNDELYLDFIAEYVLDVEEPEPGDIVVFKYARCFSHGGIWTERNTIIHAWGRTVHGGVQESKLIFFGARPRKFYAVR
jgi:cell wall-associated NlpC family hydrolase